MEGNKVRVIHAGYDRTVPACRVMPYNDEKFEVIEEESNQDVHEIVDNVETEHVVQQTETNDVENTGTHDVTDEDETNNLESRPKLHKSIKFKLFGENVPKLGKVVKVGKNDGKYKNRVWVKKDGNVANHDFIKDVSTWKYDNLKGDSKAVTFSEDTKKSEEGDVHDKNEPKENESTGVWFLKNKDQINEEILEKEAHEVFATEVPTKFHAEPEVIAAKEAELDRWKEYKAYEEIEFDNQHILTTRWVITEKDGGKIKGRLCVCGFQEKIYPQSDSPTALKDSFKTFLAIAANESFEIKTLYVTAAFLQGHPLERDVFVWPPPERAEEGLV